MSSLTELRNTAGTIHHSRQSISLITYSEHVDVEAPEDFANQRELSHTITSSNNSSLKRDIPHLPFFSHH